MNIRTGLRTLALALPLAMTPLKSSAQKVVKQAEKTVEADALKFRGSFGAGVAYEPFLDMGTTEAKVAGTLNLSARNMNASLKAKAGSAVKSVEADLAYPIKLCKEKLSLNFGGFFRYQHVSNKSGMKNVILSEELSNSGATVYSGAQTIGVFTGAGYKVNNKLELTARAEAGNIQLTQKKGSVDYNSVTLVNKKSNALDGNFGLGAKYDINKNLSLTGDVKYSTYHNSAGFSAGAQINLE